ncbi:MAG: YggS family pyridoxal phosphate-dependent enzyme [Leptolyngbya sp.]|nr:YggS family pyridoxal phosphate-dependent enzyme [Leptolyngbya sp.]
MTAASSVDRDRIAHRVQTIRATLPPTTRLIAVTKKQPVAAIRAAYAAGVRDFGESRLQEAEAKQAALADYSDITWHLIGHLQSNKARKALQQFQWIHSIDSLKLAQRLDALAADLGCQPRCCLQVKMVPDPPKTGFTLEELWEALPTLAQLVHLDIQGLMTIPPLNTDPETTQEIFEAARDLRDRINLQGLDHLHLTALSMGMSGDYPLAIAAGSTMVRLGTTLFGDRPA